MTIQRTFFDWARSGLDWSRPPYEQMSPNLLALNRWLVDNFGGQPLGLTDVNREIRTGGTISDHAYGAALDWRYEPGWLPNTNPREVSRAKALELVDHIIDWSHELGIDRIHDYVGDRIWTAGRTADVADAHGAWWKPQNGAGSGMGEAWARYFHFATHRDMFANATPIAARGVPLPGAPTPPPDPDPAPPPTEEDDDMPNHPTVYLAYYKNAAGEIDGLWRGDGMRAERVPEMVRVAIEGTDKQPGRSFTDPRMAKFISPWTLKPYTSLDELRANPVTASQLWTDLGRPQ